jgi:hypothetical protein
MPVRHPRCRVSPVRERKDATVPLPTLPLPSSASRAMDPDREPSGLRLRLVFHFLKPHVGLGDAFVHGCVGGHTSIPRPAWRSGICGGQQL